MGPAKILPLLVLGVMSSCCGLFQDTSCTVTEGGGCGYYACEAGLSCIEEVCTVPCVSDASCPGEERCSDSGACYMPVPPCLTDCDCLTTAATGRCELGTCTNRLGNYGRCLDGSMPPPPPVEPPPATVFEALGAPCLDDARCGDRGLCLRPNTDVWPSPDWLEGYCIAQCEPRFEGACEPTGRCLDNGGDPVCLQSCGPDLVECRRGYTCDPALEVCRPGCDEDDECVLVELDGELIVDPSLPQLCDAVVRRCYTPDVEVGGECARDTDCGLSQRCDEATACAPVE